MGKNQQAKTKVYVYKQEREQRKDIEPHKDIPNARRGRMNGRMNPTELQLHKQTNNKRKHR